MANRPIRSWFWKILRLIVVVLLIAGLVDVLIIAGRHGAAMFGRGESAKEVLKLPVSKPSPTPAVLSPFNPTDRYSPYDFLSMNPDVGNKPILNETLRLEVTPARIFACYDVYLSKHHPLLEIVQTNEGAAAADTLVTDVLGPVRINSNLLKFYPAETSVSADDPNAHVYITSESIKPTMHDFWINIEYPYKSFGLRINKREVVFQTNGAQVWSYDKNSLYSNTSGVTVFTRQTNSC